MIAARTSRQAAARCRASLLGGIIKLTAALRDQFIPALTVSHANDAMLEESKCLRGPLEIDQRIITKCAAPQRSCI